MAPSEAVTPDYGIDAPGTLRRRTILGGLLILAGLLVGPIAVEGVTLPVRPLLLFAGSSQLAAALLMLMYTKSGRFLHRDRLLALVEWRGDERVLDVGTGRGLLVVGAARRISRGRVVGIDLESASDERTAALTNAGLVGVAERVELLTMDARQLAFPDASFDVVVSNQCLHRIPDAAGRTQACREMVRVLAPGGTALLSDSRHTDEYARVFRDAGLSVELHGPYFADTFPPLKIVRAAKA